LTALVADLDDAGAATPVPATPAWTVADVIAHLAGLTTDVTNGNVEGAGTDPWTEVQVRDRKGTPIAELLAEWDTNAPNVENLLATVTMPAVQRIIADLVTHEHDVRGALEQPGDRDSAGVDTALQLYVLGLDARLKGNNLGPLRLVAGIQEWVIGSGAEAEPQATVRADAFELFRAVSGRRSRTQVEDFDWEGDPAPFIEHFPQFAYPSTDLIE
jgi:uncharacterized protein (TIGR03083 family)